eukprot:5948121-Pleurochrysis_carterae.AAC.2
MGKSADRYGLWPVCTYPLKCAMSALRQEACAAGLGMPGKGAGGDERERRALDGRATIAEQMRAAHESGAAKE